MILLKYFLEVILLNLEVFDPDNITKQAMRYAGESFENYLDELSSSMYIPPDAVSPRQEKDIKKGIKLVRKMISELYDGKKDKVFNLEDWESLF